MPSTQYLTLAVLKNSLDIDPGNDSHDNKLQDIIYDANEEIDARLRPYAEGVPLEPGSSLFVQAVKCAATYARMMWYEYNFHAQQFKTLSEIFDSKIESLIKTAISERTDRTALVFIAPQDRTDRTYQPFNLDEYLTREF